MIHQAIAAAYAGRGVAHLTVPVDVLTAKASGGVASIATLKPSSEIFATEEDIAETARRIACDAAALDTATNDSEVKNPIQTTLPRRSPVQFGDFTFGLE